MDEATALVGKIVAYEKAGAGMNDGDLNFEKEVSAIKTLLPSMSVSKILQGADANAAANLLSLFNAGLGLVTYFGHGSTEMWQGHLLDSAVASTLANGAAAVVAKRAALDSGVRRTRILFGDPAMRVR